MRPALPLFAVLLSACAVPAGQRISATFFEHIIDCRTTDDGRRIARFTLMRNDDFVSAELRDLETNEMISAPYRREGLIVRYTCPEGIDELFVRHITINTRQAGGRGDDDGGGRQAP